MFAAADENGDGCLDQEEMTAVLQQLGRQVTPEDVQAVMESADLDNNSVIDFNEFLRLFQTQLLDLPRLLRYIKMRPLVRGVDVDRAGRSNGISSQAWGGGGGRGDDFGPALVFGPATAGSARIQWRAA